MINVKIDETTALDMLVERVEYWTDDRDEIKLFEKMYRNSIDGGVFESIEFDPMVIVDNDWVNYCTIIRAGEKDFDKLVELYKRDGLTDVSCEDFEEYKISFIESVDDEDDPTMFLVRL